MDRRRVLGGALRSVLAGMLGVQATAARRKHDKDAKGRKRRQALRKEQAAGGACAAFCSKVPAGTERGKCQDECVHGTQGGLFDQCGGDITNLCAGATGVTSCCAANDVCGQIACCAGETACDAYPGGARGAMCDNGCPCAESATGGESVCWDFRLIAWCGATSEICTQDADCINGPVAARFPPDATLRCVKGGTPSSTQCQSACVSQNACVAEWSATAGTTRAAEPP
jgi:hypothetical protein